MDYFGRRSPKPEQSRIQQLDQAEEKKYHRLERAFLKQVTLIENFSSQLEKYEMSLRESKKCLHALTDTMSKLYQGMGPSDKEFRVAMEDHERLLEYKAHAIHTANNVDVNKFREEHNHGKILIRERDARKREHEAASEALRKLYKMGKGSDRRVPKVIPGITCVGEEEWMEGELNNMSQKLSESTAVAIRDLPLAIILRGSFIAQNFPKIFKAFHEYSLESLKVSDVLCDIVRSLDGIHVGFDGDSTDKFFSMKRHVRHHFLQKHRPLAFEEEDEEEDDVGGEPRMKELNKENKSPINTQKQDRTPPSGRRGLRSSPTEERFFDAPTRLFDSNGRLLI